MIIGVPKEIKNHEYRVGLTPSVVRELTRNGHEVIVEKHSGSGIGLENDQYEEVGGAHSGNRQCSVCSSRHDR